MIRNPFDVMASLKESHIHTNCHKFTDLMAVQSRNWRRSASLGVARQMAAPENYFVLKYEDFVDDPDAGIERLCAFLGVALEQDRMLNRTDYAYYDTNTSFPSGTKKDNSSKQFIYRSEARKSHLAKEEVASIAKICGELASALGYSDPDLICYPPEFPHKEAIPQEIKKKLRSLARRLLR